MKLDNFGSTFRQSDGTLRSLSSPALAKSRQHATRTLLKALEDNKVDSVRRLALFGAAELDGCRAYNRQGKNPWQIVDSAGHFLPEDRKRLQAELKQLPQLLAAGDFAGAVPSFASGTCSAPKPLRGVAVLHKAPGTRRFGADASGGVNTVYSPGSPGGGDDVADFQARGRVTSGGLHYPGTGTYKVGDRVRVRDSEALEWRPGTVVSLGPLKVRRDGQTIGHAFRFIAPEAPERSAVCAYSVAHPSAPVLMQIPDGERIEIVGDIVGEFIRVSWKGQQVWVDRRDATITPFMDTLEASSSIGDTLDAQGTITIFGTRPGNKDGRSASKGVADFSCDNMSTVAAPLQATLLGGGNTLSGRDLACKTAMSQFANTVGDKTKARDAAFKNPLLLKAPADIMSKTMPVMASTFHSHELALRTATLNPRLLHVDPAKYKSTVPMLNVLLGSEEEAAYAIQTRPELLHVPHAQQFKDTVQILSDCIGSMMDAVWLVTQNIAPVKLTLTARECTLEALAGEYTRCKGVRLQNRPVYKKPASSIANLFGERASDYYFRFDPAGIEGPNGEAIGAWCISRSIEESVRSERRNSKFKPASKESRITSQKSMLARAASERNSPDQVLEGTWEFRLGCTFGDKESNTWSRDIFVKVEGSKPNVPCLLLQEPESVRCSYDLLQEAVGTFWRKASPTTGAPLPGARLMGCFRRGDLAHTGGQWALQTFGDFTPKNRYTYLRISGPETLTLQAWEPMDVYLLYFGPEEVPVVQLPPEPVVEPAAGGKKRAPGGKIDSAGSRESKRPADAIPPPVEHRNKSVLLSEGWWQRSVLSLHPPTVVPFANTQGLNSENSSSGEGDAITDSAPGAEKEREGRRKPPKVEDVFVRGYPRGVCHVPIPVGPHGPPLVFTRPQVVANAALPRAQGGERPCQSVNAMPGEPIFLPDLQSVEGTGGVQNDFPQLRFPGDFGYGSGSPFRFIRMPRSSRTKSASEAWLRIDTADRIRVILVFLKLPLENSMSKASKGDPLTGLPTWVTTEGWRNYLPQGLVSVVTSEGTVIEAFQCRQREFTDQVVTIKGPGSMLSCLVFWTCVGAERPDAARQVILEEPGLLGAEKMIRLFIWTLRKELGDSRARRLTMERRSDWAVLCQEAGEAEIAAWIRSRKVEAFDRSLADLDMSVQSGDGQQIPPIPKALDKQPILSVSVLSSAGLSKMGFGGQEAWCVCCLKRDGAKRIPIFHTKHLSYTADPKWHETHEVLKWRPGTDVEFLVCDKDCKIDASGDPVGGGQRTASCVVSVVVGCDKFVEVDGGAGLDAEIPLRFAERDYAHIEGATISVSIAVISDAKALIQRLPSLASISAPIFSERCATLKQCLGDSCSMRRAATRAPSVLAASQSDILHAMEVLRSVFDETMAQIIARQHTHFLTQGRKLEAFFNQLMTLFPQIWRERLQSETVGEWARWKEMLKASDVGVAAWLGKLAAEERSLTCNNRVGSFGCG